MIKPIIYFVVLTFFSCSTRDDINQDIFSKCNEREVRIVLKEAIPATVKSIEDGDYFYDGNRFYLEVDAEIHLPELANKDSVSIIRIFAPANNIGEIGEELMVKGTISTCVSGAHGRLTNNLHLFYLIENLKVTK
ncbi:hypothetical protein BC962_1411 [Gillisia mitskevichiae]|uniref:Lipoprotein n=2 Tax=Gillisia mitskevichiae TaxID=270921 RepID=A0A495PRC8_9FLAO|nr:hypothetical protein BC962_1411 [Gillisia mitskevichiae]